MEWSEITDQAALRAGFRSGQFESDAGTVLRNEVDALLKSNPDTVIAQADPNVAIFQWGFHLEKPPFNDVRVRRAFSMGFDRQTLINTGSQGNALVMTNFPWNTIFDKQPQPADFGPYYQYNPSEAKKLLEAAGQGSGFDCPADYYPYATYLTNYIQICQQQLAQIGIRAESTPWSTRPG